jgi:hypothetical protein
LNKNDPRFLAVVAICNDKSKKLIAAVIILILSDTELFRSDVVE